MAQLQVTLPSDLPVCLHLGAHKTATTYIQHALRHAAPVLEQDGTIVLTPAELRTTRTPEEKRMSMRAKRRALRHHLAATIGAAIAQPRVRRLAISEEGIIGSPANNLSHRSLYADLVDRLQALPDGFDAPNVTIMFAIRGYARFHSSGFTTALRRGRTLPVDGLAEALIASSRGWLDVMQELRAKFPASRLFVWRYEDFADVRPRVFTEMVGRDLDGPRDKVFRTLSHHATEALYSELMQPAAKADLKRMIRTVSEKYPLSDTNPAFSLFDGDQTAELEARYAADWQQAQRLFPDAVLYP